MGRDSIQNAEHDVDRNQRRQDQQTLRRPADLREGLRVAGRLLRLDDVGSRMSRTACLHVPRSRFERHAFLLPRTEIVTAGNWPW